MYQFIEVMNQIRTTNQHEQFRLFPHLPTASGIWMSIQGSTFHYCEPRETLADLNEYHAFEVALFGESKRMIHQRLAQFPRKDELGEIEGDLVFPYLPKDLVEDLYRWLNDLV